MPILEADGLVKIYGRRRVVDGVSLKVEPGEIVGLLGANGAGKTTSFKMICGLVKPNKGRVFLQGADVTRWPMHERSRSGNMGYLPQQSSVFAKLTAEQNLRGMMQLLGFSRKAQRTRCEELLEQFKIAHIRKTKAGALSGGERRRLEIARCLVSDPKIIMLDEPFAGIDPVTVQNVQVVIMELAQAGIAVLITDHAAREILQITDRTYVVSEGRILCSGTAEQIVSNEQVKATYLGEIELPSTRLNLDAEGLATRVPTQTHGSTPRTDAPAAGVPSAQAVAAPSSAAPRPTPQPVGTRPVSSGSNTVPPATPGMPPASAGIPASGRPPLDRAVPSANESPVQVPEEQQVISMLHAIGKSAAEGTDADSKPDRPKLVFSKPRRSKGKMAAPFKSSDLD